MQMSEHTREQEALYNSFRTGKFVEAIEDGWVFALGDGEEALVPSDDLIHDPKLTPVCWALGCLHEQS